MTVGQKVVCINSTFPLGIEKAYTALPVKDSTYVIRAIAIGQNIVTGEQGEVILLLFGLNNPKRQKTGLEPGFKQERFRELEEVQQESKLRVGQFVTTTVSA